MDKIIRIKCDVCGETFGCKYSDISKKFLFGSYCSVDCMKRLIKAINDNPPMEPS